jgi:hypothetical protein
VKFAKDRVKKQKEKEHFLAKQMGVKEVVTKALHFMMGLAQMEEEMAKI